MGLPKESCEECQLKKRKVASKGLVVKLLLSKDLNCRGQVDLVDMQSLPDGDYKFIMHYQDHLTKFSVLKAFTSKRDAEIGYQLLDIFILFGAPHILQSENGPEFTANVIKELKDWWPDSCIVHGKPRHPQSQGSVERGNADIKDMLIIWMRGNNSTSWKVGLKCVQFNKKNNSHHSGINRTPYKAMFRSDAKMGLTSSPLPQEILSTLSTEKDLVAHLENKQTHDPTIQMSSVQACDNPSTDANDFVHDVPSEASLDIVQCAVCEMACFDFMKYSVCKCLYQVRVITVFTVFRLLTDFVCLYNYEF